MTTNFRGFGVADSTFEKKVENCSACVEDSCSTRDCLLQIYTIGDEKILSGGSCPKGYSSQKTKATPNYVRSYNKILEDHLSGVTTPLQDLKESDRGRVLIPRTLTFLNEKGVFYSALYDALGFQVSVSPESNDEISDLGKSHAHSESCYPVILAHGHSAFLKPYLREGLDKMLLINAIGSKEGEKKSKFCPYVASSGFVTKGSLNLEDEDVLLPIIRFNDSNYPIEDAVKFDLDRVFPGRFSKRKIVNALEEATQRQGEFLDNIYSKGKKIVEKLSEKGEKIYIGIGRGYTLLDPKASSKVHELFSENGLHFIPSFFLHPSSESIDDVADNMFWYQGKNMIRYNLMVAQNPNLFPVRETNFNCGTDSLILIHEEDIMKKADKPHLVLETDGHNSNAQFGTRIRANNEVVSRHKQEEVSRELLSFKHNMLNGLKKRIIGVPYMGDDADILSASIRAIGFNSEVMPSRTPKSLEYARKYVSTNTCRPFSFQVGDHLAWLDSLRERGIDPNKKAATFMAKAEGPCRFGQYSVMLRKYFDDSGFDEVPIFDPSAEGDYLDLRLSKKDLKNVTSLSFKGCFANDVLQNAQFRTRPYELNKGETDRVYTESHNDLVSLIENNSSLKQLRDFMYEQVPLFENIPKNNDDRYPLVQINGEIFVRCHEQANQDSIRLLEENDLEVTLIPISDWINYVNQKTTNVAWDTKNFVGLGKSLLKGLYIKNVSRKLFKPFSEYLKGREFHNPYRVVSTLERDLVFSSAIEGESLVNIGESYAFINGDLDVDGIYHVGPFGCMHETVTTSRIRSLIERKKRELVDSDTKPSTKLIPYIDAVFGESELPNLKAQIALFAENCRLKRDLKKQNK